MFNEFPLFDDFIEIVFTVGAHLVAVEIILEEVGVPDEDIRSLFRQLYSLFLLPFHCFRRTGCDAILIVESSCYYTEAIDMPIDLAPHDAQDTLSIF